MNPILKTLIDFLAKLTGPLKGNRTAIGIVACVALLVYAAMGSDYVLAGIAFTQLLIALGLRPEDVPLPLQENPDILPMQPRE
jgi:hypothetical protein